MREITQWIAQQLKQDQRDYLAHLPEHSTLRVEGLGSILFCHATPRSDEEIFTPLTPQRRLSALVAGVASQIVVCGHTHIQFDLQVSVRILNAGSVGMPYADRPGAYWLLFGSEGSEFRRIAYDLEAAAKDIWASGYPQVREFTEENVLRVPTAEEAMEIFERKAAAD